MPDNRELVSAVLVALLVIAAVVIPASRQAIPRLLRAVFVSRLLVLWLLYLGYSVAMIWAASRVGLWVPSLAWATALVVFTGGMPLLFRTLQQRHGRDLIRTVARDVFGVSVVVTIYVDSAPFSLPVEVLVQVLAALFGAMRVVAATEPKYRPARLICDVVLSLIAVAMVWHTSAYLASGLPPETWRALGLTAALTVWFPLALVPFLYAFAYYAAAESAASRVRAFAPRDHRPAKIPTTLRLLSACRFRLGYAKAFTGEWARRLSRASTRDERRQLLREYRTAWRAQAKMRRK